MLPPVRGTSHYCRLFQALTSTCTCHSGCLNDNPFCCHLLTLPHSTVQLALQVADALHWPACERKPHVLWWRTSSNAIFGPQTSLSYSNHACSSKDGSHWMLPPTHDFLMFSTIQMPPQPYSLYNHPYLLFYPPKSSLTHNKVYPSLRNPFTLAKDYSHWAVVLQPEIILRFWQRTWERARICYEMQSSKRIILCRMHHFSTCN